MMSVLSANAKLRWIIAIALALTGLVMLTFRVNAVKSEVRELETRIIAAEQRTMLLETEFQTRASQRQLASWNALEFGYAAPRADQYIDDRRELASLGEPLGRDAPSPIRVARAAVARDDVGAMEALADSLSDTALGETGRTVRAATTLLAMNEDRAFVHSASAESEGGDLAAQLSQIAPMGVAVSPSLSASLVEQGR